ncbi:T9SS type A sorting domain-containing protein, partial [Candidatus Desantisbacteria bacterium]|nr:T9SS type A sorting domain-containing protein [Candidatus Desantisbacteria bacterium]
IAYTYHSQVIAGGSNIRHLQIIATKNSAVINKGASSPGFADLKIYPNPTTRTHMRFDFSGKATIKIFTLSGELVQTLTDVDGTEAKWNLTNSDGQTVASGVYLYMISNTQDKRYGKLAVIR